MGERENLVVVGKVQTVEIRKLRNCLDGMFQWLTKSDVVPHRFDTAFQFGSSRFSHNIISSHRRTNQC